MVCSLTRIQMFFSVMPTLMSVLYVVHYKWHLFSDSGCIMVYSLVASLMRASLFYVFYMMTAGINVKVYAVDLSDETISPPVNVRAYVQLTVSKLKALVAGQLGIDAPEQLRCVADLRAELKLLAEPERTLKAEGFGKNNKVRFSDVINRSLVAFNFLTFSYISLVGKI